MMWQRYRTSQFVSIAIACLCVLTASGCGSKASYNKYIPPPNKAQEALEAMLASWSTKGISEKVETFTPQLQIVDSVRKKDQKLNKFEVLGEIENTGGPRCFTVKLSLSNPAEEQKVRYFVVGSDPLWIFRQEDYEKIGHWEHPMEETPKKPTK